MARGSCPKIARRVSRGRNGASIKLVNRHLSHSPHQRASRASTDWVKARLQLRKTGWNDVSPAKARATQTSLRSRRKLATVSASPTRSAIAAARSRSASQDLLHWWFTSSSPQRRFGIDAECSLLIATPP